MDKCKKCNSEAIDVIYYGNQLVECSCRECGYAKEFEYMDNSKSSIKEILIFITLLLSYGVFLCL